MGFEGSGGLWDRGKNRGEGGRKGGGVRMDVGGGQDVCGGGGQGV